MSRTALAIGFFAGVVAFSLSAVSANAQATRTWVSGVGDDVNPCSRTAPCKTFAGAISKTAINGIIDCLDAGAFGAVTITKSITIDCHEIFAGVLASGTTGVIINIAAGNPNDPLRTVRIRNLRIDGSGPGLRTGIRGMNILNAAVVYVEDTIIQNFTNEGILAQSATALDLFVRNSVIADNNGTGLSVVPPAAQSARVQVNNVFLDRNGVGISIVKATNPISAINLVSSSLQGNTGAGVRADGASASIAMFDSIVSRNGAGVIELNSGVIASFGNNFLRGNSGVNATLTPLPLE